MPHESPYFDKLDELGIDAFCDLILDGKTYLAIAEQLGIQKSGINKWLHKDKDRSARALDARRMAAATWDELASQTIEKATNRFDLDKAKELAHHYRWRASKVNPKEYGAKPGDDNDEPGVNRLEIVNSPDAD